MTERRYLTWLVPCSVSLLLLTGLGSWALHYWQHDLVVYLMFAAALPYAAAVALTLRAGGSLAGGAHRRAVILILATAILARVLLLPQPPVSTDIYRYIWDGRVQAAGINPYRYKPADPAEAFLRDRQVYPLINRAATAVTIYPPFAQMIFFSVTRIANSRTGMKTAMLGFDLVTLGALLGLLAKRRLPPTRILLYAWHPLPLFEFAGSGHIDAAAIALLLLAWVAAERRRQFTAGALLGAATLVKYFPLVVAPALYRRWGWRFPAALALVVTALYIPYLSVGWRVLGFLPGYVSDEGLAAGTGFFLLDAVQHVVALPAWAPAAYVLAGMLLLGALAWRTPERAPRAMLALLTVFTLWLSPHLPWYFTWLLPFLCFQPSWALIYVASAAPLLYRIVWDPDSLWLQASLYVPFAIIFIIEARFGLLQPPQEPADDARLESRHPG